MLHALAILLSVFLLSTSQASAQPVDNEIAHVGSVRDAIVGVTATPQEGSVVHGNGLLIRCDGFVLLPVNLCEPSGKVPPQVSVTFFPGSEKEKVVAARLVVKGLPNAGFVVARVDNFHAPEGAARYAAWRGKRLPTPYEWCLAAFGPGGQEAVPDWVRQYAADRYEAAARIEAAHFDERSRHPDALAPGDNLFIDHVNWEYPWIPRSEALAEFGRFSQRVIQQETDRISETWRDPLYIRPVGERSFDVSPCGARDMIMNASELASPSPYSWVAGTERYIEVRFPEGNCARPFPPFGDAQYYQTSRNPLVRHGLIPSIGTDFRHSATPRGLELPPLSRLIARSPDSPPAHILKTLAAIEEAIQLAKPVSGWTVGLSPGHFENYILGVSWVARRHSDPLFARAPHSAAVPLEQIGPEVPSGDSVPDSQRGVGYALWRSPARFRMELGRELPIDRPSMQGIDTAIGRAELYFLAHAGGFRCAR